MQTDDLLHPEQINETAYDDLIVSVEASENTLSLLLAVCNDFQLREEIIQRYEAELNPTIPNYRVTLTRTEPSLKQAISQTIEKGAYLKAGGKAVFTVLGAERLLQLRYGAERSEQEIFLGYLQWTREGLQEFQYPIILWLTEPLLEEISRKAKDFWSWRKDVFRFVSETPTLLDRPEVAQIPQNLPYLGNITFVGRERELEVLHEQFGTTTIVAIAGMGGIGKTELALQYAAKYSSDYPGGICWLRAREDVGTQIVVFARRFLGLEPPSELSITEQVAWSWRHWILGNVLIIFDDVQNYLDIRALLPPPDPRFKIVLTTRSRIGSPVGELLIGILPTEVALELLRSLVPDGRIDHEFDAATQLCEWLGYLPLGLELVGRYLARKKGVSIAKLWQRLQEQRLVAVALLDAEAGMTASLGVTAAFELSWQELNEEAQQLAALLSLFALAEIPWTLVQTCLPETDEEDLESLRDAQLVNLSLLTSTKAEMYELHPLLREFFAAKRSRMPTDEEMKRSFCRGISSIDLQISLPLTIATIEQMAPLIPHLKEATTTLEPWLADADLMKLSTWIGLFYQGQSAFEEAEKWFLHGRTIAMQRLGTSHPNVATSLNNLAELYRAQGRYEEAKPLYLQALEIYQRQLEPDLLSIAQSLNNLAFLYYSQGQYEEAKPFYLKALEIREQRLGAEHLDVAQSLNNLAELYRSQGQYGEAEPLYLRALEIRQRQLGRDHLDAAMSLNNLAELYQSQGRYGEAEPLLLQALGIRQRQLGPSHPDVAQSLNNLAGLHYSQGRYGEAEPLLLQALGIRQRQLGPSHPDVAQSLNNLAALYRLQGRYEEAEPLYHQALQVSRQTLGEAHPAVAIRLNNLAGLYVTLGCYTEAERLYLQAIAISNQRLGDMHPNTQTFLRNFREFLQQVIQYDRTAELSCDRITRSLLQELQKVSNRGTISRI
jgi:tetratricopeptide (TPR) repeat protein